jgi:thioester reductase-like protein
MTNGMPKERIVVTGATGFVGANLVQRLLQDHPDARLTLLLREENGTQATDRAADMLKRLRVDPADRTRVEGIRADVCLERCGISAPGCPDAIIDTVPVDFVASVPGLEAGAHGVR